MKTDATTAMSAGHAAAKIDLRHVQYLQTRYFTALDGLRCASILAVIFHHAVPHTSWWSNQGQAGVQLFFAISGFLITTLLLRERDAYGQISLGKFYVRRGLRIFPLYYATLAVYVALVALLERQTADGREFFNNLPAFLTYTSNWFVKWDQGKRVIFYFAWSLAAEEQFYLVWPSVVRFSRRPAIAIGVMVGAVAAWQAARLITWAGGEPFWARVLAAVSPAICLGAVLAYVLHGPAGFRRAAAVLGRWWGVPATALLISGSIAATGNTSLVTAAAMSIFLGAVVVRPRNVLSPVLDLVPVRYVGTISYGMYMLHMLGMQAARKVSAKVHGGPAVTFVVAVGLAVLLATVSYWTFELRFLKLKERFGKVAARQSRVAESDGPAKQVASEAATVTSS